MKEYGKLVRNILLEHGCTFLRRGKGDHDRWHSPINNHNVTVNGKIPSRYEANEVLRQAGIKQRIR
jgi:hypothetical protein